MDLCVVSELNVSFVAALGCIWIRGIQDIHYATLQKDTARPSVEHNGRC